MFGEDNTQLPQSTPHLEDVSVPGKPIQRREGTMVTEHIENSKGIPDDEERLKLLRKDMPAVKDWKKFDGQGEYNHLVFIDWITKLQKDIFQIT